MLQRFAMRGGPCACTFSLLVLNAATQVPGATDSIAGIPDGDDVVWRMIVLPDTQKYAQFESNMPIFHHMIQWMVDNKESLKLGLVLTEGDIVEHWFPDDEWLRMQGAYSNLNGQLPYVLIPGNHDAYNGAPRRPSKMNQFFSASDNPLNDPTHGGILKGTMAPDQLDNAYYEFTAPDGRNLLITALEWSPRNGTVNWADSIAGQSRYQDYTAILTTHAYLYYDGQRYDYATWGDTQLWNIYSVPTSDDPDGANDGEAIWQKLVHPNPNYEMVFSGHVIGDQVDRLTSVNESGRNVYQMVFNAQNDPKGGDGWLRILEFLDDGRTVRVRTYSPWLESLGMPSERLTDDHNFYITLQQLGDLNRDGFVGISDLSLVLGNWNQFVEAGVWQLGDLSGDGYVGIEDLNVVLGYWNEAEAPDETENATIPEPAMMSPMLWGIWRSLAGQRRRPNGW